MQGNVATDQRRIVENQHEQSYIMAAINEKLDRIMENCNNSDQFLQTLTACFDDSKIMARCSPATDLIDLPIPTLPMPIPVLVEV